MNLDTYLLHGELHTLSAEFAQSLNSDLAGKSYVDIPTKHKGRVADYIIAALQMETVELELVPLLETLLNDLQKTA